MHRAFRHLAVAGFTAVLLVGVAVLGQIPMGKSGGQAVLRLSLRSVHSKAEVCRDRTAAELEALSQHMRQRRICEEVAPAYRLRVSLDAQTVLEERVEPGGLRGDRPLIVDRQVEVAPGAARLEIDFNPIADLRLEETLARASVELPRYALAREVTLESNRITLVTLDDANARLEIWNGGKNEG